MSERQLEIVPSQPRAAKSRTAERKRMRFHENLGMRLRGAYLSMHRRTNAHFARFGMTSDQFVILSLLNEEDGITQQELAERSYSDRNTITAMLALLEKRELVLRQPHASDRRARIVLLTEEGRQMSHRLTRSLDRFHAEFRSTLPADQPEVILTWLSAVADVMRKP